jgi:hypothetical protein
MVLEFLSRFASGGENDFERLAKEEEALRTGLRESGRLFSAGDRLTRAQLHDRNALR